MTNLDFEMTVETIVEPIEESESIHPDNKELLIDYKGDLTLDGLSMATVQKRLSHLKVVAEHIGDRRFDELDKDEMKDLIKWIQGRDTAESTIESYK